MKTCVITAIIPGCGQWNLGVSKRGVRDENAQKACFSGWLCIAEWRLGSGGIRKKHIQQKEVKASVRLSPYLPVFFCWWTKTRAALPNSIINSTTFVVSFLAAPATEVRRLVWLHSLPPCLPPSPAMPKACRKSPTDPDPWWLQNQKTQKMCWFTILWS